MPGQSLLTRLRRGLFYYIPAILWTLSTWLVQLATTTTTTTRSFSGSTTRQWDFRTALVIAIVRAVFNDPTPTSMLEQQVASFAPDEILPHAKMRVVKDRFMALRENNLAELMSDAVNELAGSAAGSLPKIEMETVAVPGEWVTDAVSPSNPVSEPLTYIYLHGGQF